MTQAEGNEILTRSTDHTNSPNPEKEPGSDIIIGEITSDTNGQPVQILDTDQQGRILIENKSGQLQVVTEKQIDQTIAAKTKNRPTIETGTEEINNTQEIEDLVEEKIEDKDIAEIAAATKIEVEEPDTDNEKLRPGKKLLSEFKAREKKVQELIERTKLDSIKDMSYRQIDNLFYALAIMQMSLKRMFLPVEKTQKYYQAELEKLNDPKLQAFEVTAELKKEFELAAAEMEQTKTGINSINANIDNHGLWWEAQKKKEENLLDEVYNPQTGEVDYDDLDRLPDRVIIALEEILNNIHPPIKNPIESQEFYLNAKRTTEEFFKKMILDPVRFFDKLIKKERELAIMVGRFQHHNHAQAFYGAFAQFKNFVNKYTERFNNMLTLIGIDEEKLAYDYSPNYQGRAQKMKDLWAKISQENSEKIRNYRENLKTKNDSGQYDPIEEKLEKK